MTLIHRYILYRFLHWLFISTTIFISLFYLIHFFEKVDEIFSNEAHFSHFLKYLYYMTPSIAVQIFPIAVLLAVFASLGGLSRSNELTSMRAGGMSLFQTTKPLFMVGIVSGLLVFFATDQLAPRANEKADYLMQIKIKGLASPYIYKTENLFFRDGNQIIQVENAQPNEQAARGVSIYTFNDRFQLTRRQTADQAIYNNKQWTVKDYVEIRFSADGSQLLESSAQAEKVLPIQRTPYDFMERSLESTNMTLGEIQRHINKLIHEGFDPLRFRVDFHYRISSAATSLIMILVAIPFALQRGRYSNLSAGIIITLSICLVYFVCQSILIAFGYAGILPPIVAAWSTNLMFALFGSWLLLRAPS